MCFKCFTECLFEKSELVIFETLHKWKLKIFNILKISEGVVAADAVSAYFAENLDETWAEIVSTASADCATAVESIAIQNITLTKTK